MSIIKGQNFRVSIGGKILAASTSCTLHLSATLESSETKDDSGDWSSQECTGKSWDGSADSLVIVDSSETALTAFDATELIGTKVTIIFEEVSGDKNRTATSGGVQYSGEAIVNDWSGTFGNRANSTASIQFTGVSALTKGTIA